MDRLAVLGFNRQVACRWVAKGAGRVVHGLDASCCVTCERHPDGEGLLIMPVATTAGLRVGAQQAAWTQQTGCACLQDKSACGSCQQVALRAITQAVILQQYVKELTA